MLETFWKRQNMLVYTNEMNILANFRYWNMYEAIIFNWAYRLT